MKGVLKFIEWSLIFFIGFVVITIIFPRNWFDRDHQIQKYKQELIYQAVDLGSQYYYGGRVSIRGVAYGNGELTVYMKGIGFGDTGRAPHRIKVTTDQGEELNYGGGGSSNDLWSDYAHYVFRSVPDDMKQIIVTAPVDYINGDAFSFTINLEGGQLDDN